MASEVASYGKLTMKGLYLTGSQRDLAITGVFLLVLSTIHIWEKKIILKHQATCQKSGFCLDV